MALDIVSWGAITFGLTVGIQAIFFLIATLAKTDKVGYSNHLLLPLLGD